MGKKTSLYDQHLRHHARMVDFAGFDMPLHYGSQLEEHQAVRRHAGIFDVSHMNIVDISGENATAFLSYILANNIQLISAYKALYSCLLNTQGGVIDDLIVYKLSDNQYRLILNAGTKEKDIHWIRQQSAEFMPEFKPPLNICTREDLSIIALQGPEALSILADILEIDFKNSKTPEFNLKPFGFILYQDMMIARTGYTGEDGVELIVNNTQAENLWQKLCQAGARPAGLGARDSLRLEAGFNLYGQDMDENTSPLESGLAWTIALDSPERDFIGRKALLEKMAEIKNNPQKTLLTLTGIMLEKGGILRHNQKIMDENHQEIGTVTSGGFSPVLNCSIGFARISLPENPSEKIQNKNKLYYVRIRDKLLPIKIMPQMAFVRRGKIIVSV